MFAQIEKNILLPPLTFTHNNVGYGCWPTLLSEVTPA